jgi:hypothetical protein
VRDRGDAGDDQRPTHDQRGHDADQQHPLLVLGGHP